MNLLPFGVKKATSTKFATVLYLHLIKKHDQFWLHLKKQFLIKPADTATP